NSVTVTIDPSTSNSGTVSYEYEVRESGAPGSGTTGVGVTGIATTNPFTITGLQPLTKYKIYVRTVCAATNKSSGTSGPAISNNQSFYNYRTTAVNKIYDIRTSCLLSNR